MSVNSENETVGSDAWLGYRGLTSYHTLAKASQLSIGFFCFQYTRPNLKCLLLFSFSLHFKLQYSQLSGKCKQKNTTS